ncbi:MAG: hypothetical protein QOD99_902, partial [Chthoniobacter sp.]|nr:hypothetical protein [Chthoniobacter sp.]
PVDYLARPDFIILAGSLIVYLTVALFLPRAMWRLSIFWGLLLFGAAHVVVGIIQFKRGDQFMLLPWIHRTDTLWRASGFYISPNHFAGLMEVLALLTISVACWGSFRVATKVLLVYAACFFLLGIAISGSRGGYLSFAFGLGVFAILSAAALRRVDRKRFLPKALAGLAILGMAAVLAAVLLLQSSTLKHRVREINDPENMRFLLWRAAIEEFHIEPWVGTGSGTYLYYGRIFRDPRVQNDPIYVHNDYLHLLAEYGSAGAVLFAIFFGAHVVAGVKNVTALAHRRADEGEAPANQLALQIGAMSAIGAYALHSIVDFNLHIPANAFLMAWVFGMVANPSLGLGLKGAFSKTLSGVSRLLLAGLSVGGLAYGLPKLPGEWFAEKARAALRDYQLADVRTFAGKAMQYEKANPDLCYYYGEATREMAEQQMLPPETRQEAVEMFKKGLALFPHDVRSILKLAQTYDEMREFDLAEEQLDTAVEFDGNNSLVAAYYGMHYQLQHQWIEAQTQFQLALELDPSNKMARSGLDAVETILTPFRQANPDVPAPVIDPEDMEEEAPSPSPAPSPAN